MGNKESGSPRKGDHLGENPLGLKFDGTYANAENKYSLKFESDCSISATVNGKSYGGSWQIRKPDLLILSFEEIEGKPYITIDGRMDPDTKNLKLKHYTLDGTNYQVYEYEFNG